MIVTCFCGEIIEGNSPLPCYRCGKIAVLPTVTQREVDQMKEELEEILREH